MSAKAYWVKPPSIMVPALNQYQQKLLLAVYAIAAYVGQQMQDDARRRAKWEDRTGNARSGLFFAVDGFGIAPVTGLLGDIALGKKGQVMKYSSRKRASSTREVDVDALSKANQAVISGTTDRLVLALSHTMYYGVYLELAHGGKDAVIVSTMESHLPQLESMLNRLMKG